MGAVGNAVECGTGAVDANAPKAEWLAAGAAWWPKSALAKRGMRKRLAVYRGDGRRPDDAAIAAVLELLARVNAEDHELSALKPTRSGCCKRAMRACPRTGRPRGP